MRRWLLLPLLLAACAPAAAPAPGASGRTGPDYGDLDPGKATPVPPGLSGTPNPFASSHPNSATITFPEDGSQPPIQATYVVGLVQPVDGLVRVSCQATGKDARGTTMQFSFEAWAATAPEAPGTWTVKKDPGPAPGEARVTHFRGAGTGWLAPRGTVRLTRVERGPDVARWDFVVDAPMQPSGTDTQGRGTPPPGTPITPRPSAAGTGGTGGASGPSFGASAYRLSQVQSEFFVRWSGTFYTAPGAGR